MTDPHNLSLRLESVTKRYSRAPIFLPVTFEANQGEIVAITGANGSGKSTLLKIIAGVALPTKGICEWKRGSIKLEPRELQITSGFVSPYLELYNELTAVEHVRFVGELQGREISGDEAIEELSAFGLDKDIASGNRPMKQYSSGMQQRVRLAMAFISQPKVLFLDEPSSNLDEEGIGTLFQRIEKSSRSGALIMIATNDEREKKLAAREIVLLPFSNHHTDVIARSPLADDVAI